MKKKELIRIANVDKKIDEALLYANEYKVDLIDRIKKVDVFNLRDYFKEYCEKYDPDELKNLE